MGKHLGLLGIFALIVFACASGDVVQNTSGTSTAPVTALTSGSTSTSERTTATTSALSKVESSTIETTGLTTTSSTTNTPPPLVTAPPTTTTAPPTTTTTAPPTTHNVSIGDKFFAPTAVTITVGDTVKWTNGGKKGHTVTSGIVGNPDGLWDSGVLIGGASFSRTFTTSGTFQYFCSIHGDKMEGTVIVQG